MPQCEWLQLGDDGRKSGSPVVSMWVDGEDVYGFLYSVKAKFQDKRVDIDALDVKRLACGRQVASYASLGDLGDSQAMRISWARRSRREAICWGFWA